MLASDRKRNTLNLMYFYHVFYMLLCVNMCVKLCLVKDHSPLWKKVIAWVESNCPSDCGKVWGDVGCCHRSQCPPKQSHNRLDNYSRPRPSLIFKVGYFTVVSLVTWPWIVSEAGVYLVLIETSLLFVCKSCCSYAN